MQFDTNDNNRSETLAQSQACKLRGDALYKSHMDVTYPINMLNDALDEYSKALELTEEPTPILAKMARVWLKQGNYKKAAAAAKQVLNKQPKQADAHYVLGFIAYKQKETKTSIQHLRKAIRYSGLASSRSRFCLSYAYKEQARQSKSWMNQWSSKTASLLQLVAGIGLIGFEPTGVPVTQLIKMTWGFAEAYMKEQAGDNQGALQTYLKMHNQFPGMASLMNLIGNYYHQQGDIEEALFWIEKGLERDPVNEDGYYYLAAFMEEINEIETSIKLYQTLIMLCPRDPDLLCTLGNLYYLNHQFDEAISYYKLAMQEGQDPVWKALLAQSLGKIYQDVQGNSEAALIAYHMAIELNPQQIETYVQLGILYFENKDFKNAEAIYKQAMAQDPYYAKVYSNLGYLKWMSGEISQAIELYHQAIEIDPFYDIPCNNLGVIHLDVLGNINQAIELFEKATQLNENYALAYYNLGRAYSLINETRTAAEYFQTAQMLNQFTRELDNEELTARINNLFG